MNRLNSVIIEGKVSEIGQLTVGGTGLKSCEITIETKRCYKDNDGKPHNEKSFFVVIGYERIAKNFSQLSNGKLVRIVGRLKQERWHEQDKVVSRCVVVAEHVEICKTRK